MTKTKPNWTSGTGLYAAAATTLQIDRRHSNTNLLIIDLSMLLMAVAMLETKWNLITVSRFALIALGSLGSIPGVARRHVAVLVERSSLKGGGQSVSCLSL